MVDTNTKQLPNGRERRQHTRHPAHPDVLAFVGTEPGGLIDISEGGLAVRFVSMQTKHSFPLELDLFYPETNLYLQNLPVAVVNEITSTPHSMFSTLTSRRYCLQFGPLSNQQQALVRHFIENCRLEN
ncbi:PilZ domain-containing protein [Desulfobulbus rhabdoformis]|uniref:PilZ domain-containing protein n=1 Tax=Desulfobulbus rhabdoformis TaxID=34032 RepID=UPI001965EF5B|nr:PilZ domain-containing protein [Desulfobulbus rhabdoformis]MBM9613346.1 PilZ domain-containing protein [Desulfobulbus rhabdoformis]